MKDLDTLSDRELDALVAKRVMGWMKGGREKMHAAEGRTFFANGMRHRWEDDFGPHTVSWSPSTDISAAFEVAEAMRGKGYAPVLSPTADGKWRCVMLASLDETDSEEWVEEDATICYSRRTVRCEHANAARAIAVCALRAVAAKGGEHGTTR